MTAVQARPRLLSGGAVSAGPVSAGPVSAGPVSAGPVSAGPVSAGLVADAEELACHHRIRHAVFVDEQHAFADSDVDSRDGLPGVRHVLGRCGGVPAGAVRLYPLGEGGTWQGDRLAVLPAFRVSGLGAPLVRFAVATAGRLGGRRMIAHIQLANEVFFTRLGWTRHGDPEPYVGQPHLLMSIALRGG